MSRRCRARPPTPPGAAAGLCDADGGVSEAEGEAAAAGEAASDGEAPASEGSPEEPAAPSLSPVPHAVPATPSTATAMAVLP